VLSRQSRREETVANVFYLRIRGKSQGPYTLDQLHGFVRRGQLSRLHDVSNDGVTWGRASAYPELFALPDTAVSAKAASDPLGLAVDSAEPSEATYGLTDGDAAKAARHTPPPQPDAWYYTSNDKQCGPVDLGSLQRMLANGQVSPHEQVWAEGMAQWQSAQQIPVLMAHVPNQGSVLNDLGDLSKDIKRGLSPGVDGGKSGEVTAEACRAIAGMRPWILFVAIFWFIVAVLQLGTSILYISVVNGIVGLGMLIGSALVATAATLLVMSFNRLGNVLHTRRHRELEQGLHAMRRFWLFSGILLIVFLSVMAILVLIALAIGSSIVHAPRWNF
jgi:hypothetical protein